MRLAGRIADRDAHLVGDVAWDDGNAQFVRTLTEGAVHEGGTSMGWQGDVWQWQGDGRDARGQPYVFRQVIPRRSPAQFTTVREVHWQGAWNEIIDVVCAR